MADLLPLGELAEPLLREIVRGYVEVYNEASFQHEVGYFLRSILVDSKVRFERNVRAFLDRDIEFTKRDIDISLSARADEELQYAIELKFPRNGQYPEQMFSFCKDIAFAEELKNAGFARAGLIILSDDPLFWRGGSEGIYGFFRSGRTLTGSIQKPTGKRDETVMIRGSYLVEWRPVTADLKCAILEAQ
jgi:hypothetical protein